MTRQPDIYEGQIVGWRGYRAAVREIDGQRVRIHYTYHKPATHCPDCQGTGTIIVLDGKQERPRIQNCRRCKATGRLLAENQLLHRWVPVSELTPAPPRPQGDPEATALAVELFRKAAMS